jgi:hypothetical protein
LPTELEKKYPNIVKWIKEGGWIELGGSPYEGGAAKALKEGGCVVEGKSRYSSLDAMLKDVEAGIRSWLEENGEDLDD